MKEKEIDTHDIEIALSSISVSKVENFDAPI